VKNKNTEMDDWESLWSKYAEAASKNPAQIFRHNLILDEIRRIGGSFETLKIMDVGCGQGDLLHKISIAFPKAELAGLELSEVGAATSLKKTPKAAIFKEDILNPSNIASQYKKWANIICCSEVLEHVDDPTFFLDQVTLYICDDGFLIITVPGGPMSSFDKYIGHRRHFNKASLVELLSATKNFSPNKVYRSGFPFFNLYRLVVILRGSKLQNDVQEEYGGVSNYIALFVMRIFRFLFKANLRNSLFGWQMVIVAQNTKRNNC